MSKASANLVAAIKAANKVLSAAFASGDMKKTAACYTKNARLLAPNTPACNGQTAIARFGRFGGLFLFGSELKALRAHPGWRPQVNRDALTSFMRHN